MQRGAHSGARNVTKIKVLERGTLFRGELLERSGGQGFRVRGSSSLYRFFIIGLYRFTYVSVRTFKV